MQPLITKGGCLHATPHDMAGRMQQLGEMQEKSRNPKSKAKFHTVSTQSCMLQATLRGKNPSFSRVWSQIQRDRIQQLGMKLPAGRVEGDV